MFLLLADVFEQLKNFESLKNFGSCPSHYLNAPGLSWDVVLKITKIEPELAADPDRFIFFEKCTEGVQNLMSSDIRGLLVQFRPG